MSWQAEQSRWNVLKSRLFAPDSSVRILVLAAHPDDETIGASVLLARLANSAVAYLTDGAPSDGAFWTGGRYSSREEYARTRRAEAVCALDIAQVSEPRIHWFGARDQEAALHISELVDRTEELLKTWQPEVFVTHPYEGGHPDHDTAALVARLAVARMSRRPELVEMTSYHAENCVCVTGEFLPPQGPEYKGASPLPATNALELSPADCHRKKAMLDAYASQRLVLESFPVDRELFRPAPLYDFSQPPHEGKLWYECMGWPMTGERWRQLAAAANPDVKVYSCG
jgi:N-acetylglucosamine malate deacetylase 2